MCCPGPVQGLAEHQHVRAVGGVRRSSRTRQNEGPPPSTSGEWRRRDAAGVCAGEAESVESECRTPGIHPHAEWLTLACRVVGLAPVSWWLSATTADQMPPSAPVVLAGLLGLLFLQVRLGFVQQVAPETKDKGRNRWWSPSRRAVCPLAAVANQARVRLAWLTNHGIPLVPFGTRAATPALRQGGVKQTLC